jgi:ubiquinone/menaquinone biosynthesis C-methylase UbiE
MDTRELAQSVCPGLVHPQIRYKELLGRVLQPGVRWLDLGCGHEIVRSWSLRPNEDETSLTLGPVLCVGIDADGDALRKNHAMPHLVNGSISHLPFADCSFDVVTANMVVEHADRPGELLSEVWRVLRPKGVFVFHTPNKYYPASVLGEMVPRAIKSRLVAYITGRDEHDVYPTFYRLNTLPAISGQSEAAGFRIKYSEILETLTYHPRRVLFLSYLAVAKLLRWKWLSRFQADFMVMLCKPDVECACRRLERHA